jgi:hypothetical protein
MGMGRKKIRIGRLPVVVTLLLRRPPRVLKSAPQSAPKQTLRHPPSLTPPRHPHLQQRVYTVSRKKTPVSRQTAQTTQVVEGNRQISLDMMSKMDEQEKTRQQVHKEESQKDREQLTALFRPTNTAPDQLAEVKERLVHLEEERGEQVLTEKNYVDCRLLLHTERERERGPCGPHIHSTEDKRANERTNSTEDKRTT